MAEAVVTLFLVKLKTLLTQEESLLAGVYVQVVSLVDGFQRVQRLIGNAEMNCRKSEAMRKLVQDIINVTFDAEDAIDNYILEIERINIERKHRRRLVGFLRRHASIRKELDTRLGNLIEDIKRRINEIIGESGMDFFHEAEETSKWLHDPLLASDWEDEPVGVGDDVKTLVGRLIEGESRLTVVSIVGVGGLGKTTLAKKVYDDYVVKSHFECRAWVYVSEDRRVKEILEGLAKQLVGITKQELENMDEEELTKKLSVYLQYKRYLIVIDDIGKLEEWDGLKGAFPDAQNWSRVLLTTRERDVALYSDAWSRPHELRFRNQGESLELFQKIMGGYCPLDLENFGRRTLAKCGGLPLAIVVTAGLFLKTEPTPNAWNKIMKRLDWELKQRDDQFKSILALSYDHLPYFLKPCFLYFGLFPQDFEFQTDKLIQMWVAEGFVQQEIFVQQIGEKPMEEVAYNHLAVLVCCNMIQATRRHSNGRVKACRIHNLIRDFAILEAKELNVFRVYPNQGLSSPRTGERMLVIHNNNYVSSPKYSTPFLRSFIAININEEDLEIAFKSLFAECKLLKVLDLHGSNISRLPGEIKGLINLSYLGLRFTGLVSLPDSIRNLGNLQTLDVRGTSISSLPDSIRNLGNLRTLVVRDTSISSLPDCIGNLRNLQTLDVRGTSISSLPASIGNLENLRTLDVRDTSIGSLPDSVGNLGNLRTLDLRGTSISSLPSCIGNLWNLQTLDVRGTSIRSLPEEFWKIQHLRHVYLDEDSEIIPVSLGMDYQLKYLQTLKYARAGNWINDMLGNLTLITHLCIMDMSSSHTKGLCDSIAKLRLLTSLTLQGHDPIPKLNLSHHHDLRKLDLSVPLENLPELHEFPPDLTKLNLLWSELMQDPLPTLGKLRKLHSLKIKANAYRGKEMGCSSLGFPQPEDLELVEMGCSSLGFPQLEDLELAGLYELERCRFQEGDMPRLKRISIWDCPSMKLLPEGLEHLTSLQVLRIFHMPEDFYSRLQENEGSFRFKIQKSGWFSKYVPL